MQARSTLTRPTRPSSRLSLKAKKRLPHVALVLDFENPDLGEPRLDHELPSRVAIHRFLHAGMKDYQNRRKTSNKYSPQSTRESRCFLSTRGQVDLLPIKVTTTLL